MELTEYRRLNVVKFTDNEVKARRLEALGYEKVEVEEQAEEAQQEVEQEVVLEELELAELKEIADEREIKYAKNANKEKMLELLGE